MLLLLSLQYYSVNDANFSYYCVVQALDGFVSSPNLESRFEGLDCSRTYCIVPTEHRQQLSGR